MKTLWALLSLACAASGQVWVQQITGSSTLVQWLAVDNQQNCFVSGIVYGDDDAADFGLTNLAPGPFFARYSRGGNLVYAQTIDANRALVMVGTKLMAVEGTNLFEIRDDGRKSLKAQFRTPELYINGMSACNENSFMVSGYFAGSLTVDDETLIGSDWTPFIARLNANGKLIWKSVLTSTGIAAGTRDGGAYLLTQDQVSGWNPFGSPYRDVIVVRAFGRRGEMLWSRDVPGMYLSVIGGIAADRQGNCFITGTFRGQMEVTGGVLDAFAQNAYVIGLSPDGSLSFGWNLEPSPFGDAPTYGYEIATDRAGNWYLGTTIATENRVFDGAVVKNGDTFNAIQFGSAVSDSFSTMTVSPDGCVYVAGHLSGAPAWIGSTFVTNSGTIVAKFKLP